MGKIARCARLVEVPHVVRGAEHVGDAVAPVGAVGAARVVLDHGAWICPAYRQQGRHRQKGQHPGEQRW